MTGWEKYQTEMADAVEERCKEGEKLARFNLLKRQANQNTAQLREIIESLDVLK